MDNTRTRRLRLNQSLRTMLQEVGFTNANLVKPVFVSNMSEIIKIDSLYNTHVFPLNDALKYIETLLNKGIRGVNIYPSLDKSDKNAAASNSINSDGIIPKTISAIKKHFPEIMVFPDIALDPYTSHGHDGILDDGGNIMNDVSVDMLVKQSVLYAQCGADFVAPSDMFDGRTKAIRAGLDKAGLHYVGIIAYAAKFASEMYGPFRSTLGNAGLVLDKKSYQLGCSNARQAIQRAMQDISEGADIIMIKPAGYYLDIISKLRDLVDCPIAAFHVSGECAMIKAAADLNLLDEKQIVLEQLTSIKRAGADIIFTYYADLVF
jgi:porphobilinogen synthase